jgi:ATP-dependent DNA ligase
MALPLRPPVLPQLAKSRAELPEGDTWVYEPKWDGFRAIAFRDGSDCFVQSRNGRPLSRYFPELKLPQGKFILDGELVILAKDGRQDFDALQQRIHPAESRIYRLAEETPVRYVAFDVLAEGRRKLLSMPFAERREILEGLAGDGFDLTPCTRERSEAEPWLQGAEGVIAKELEAPYRPGERKGMVKVKRVRTIDAVVVGWRPGKEEGTVGSLILGLYEGKQLRVVGHTSGFKAKEKRELVATLAPYESGERGSAEPSRWAAPSPAAGRPTENSNGSPCGPSWSSRSASTT